MTISHKSRTDARIKTLINLSTAKRSLMLLWNPEEIHREFWFVHVSVFGLSLVYITLVNRECPEEMPEYFQRLLEVK